MTTWNTLGLPDVSPYTTDLFNFDELFHWDHHVPTDLPAVGSADSTENIARSPADAVSAATAKAFKASIWHWEPTLSDTGPAAESSLVVPGLSPELVDGSHEPPAPSTSVSLSAEDRERLLSVLIENCDKANMARIALFFPTTEVLERFLHTALVMATQTPDLPWLHSPTFEPSLLKRELLCALVAYGAFRGPPGVIQHLGSAMPELIQLAILQQWRQNNASTRNVQLCAAYLLVMHVTFWSGNNRKMVYGESIASTLVTILRRTGMLSISHTTPSLKGNPADPSLEAQWHSWIERESLIRLVHAAFAHDTQTSMTLSKPPLFSFEELRLPLPCADELWTAPSPQAWKAAYTVLDRVDPDTMFSRPSSQGQSLAVVLRQLLLAGARSISLVDLEALAPATSEIVAYGLWRTMYEFHQQYWWLRSGDHDADPDRLLTATRFDLLSTTMDLFHRHFILPYVGPSTATTRNSIIFHFLHLILSAPVTSLPAFAGKEENSEAHRVHPMIDEWTITRQARQALWHAGQIFRLVAGLPTSHLLGIPAVAVYLAALTMWAYGLLSASRRSPHAEQEIHGPSGGSGKRSGTRSYHDEVHMDESWSSEVASFVATSTGIPTLSSNDRYGSDNASISISSCPGAVMFAAIRLLRRSSDVDGVDSTSHFLRGLCEVLGDIGTATCSAGFG